MSYEIIALPSFEKEVKRFSRKFPSLKNDLSQFNESVLKNPLQGASLGNDCYKIRLAIKSKGKGKSGGMRILMCVRVIANRIYLLKLFDKSEEATISLAEFKKRIDELNRLFPRKK